MRRVEVEGGDETGSAIFVLTSASFIKPGIVVNITNAKVYSFHGTKQIQQQTKNSIVSIIDEDIEVSDKYTLHKKRSRYHPKK